MQSHRKDNKAFNNFLKILVLLTFICISLFDLYKFSSLGNGESTSLVDQSNGNGNGGSVNNVKVKVNVRGGRGVKEEHLENFVIDVVREDKETKSNVLKKIDDVRTSTVVKPVVVKSEITAPLSKPKIPSQSKSITKRGGQTSCPSFPNQPALSDLLTYFRDTSIPDPFDLIPRPSMNDKNSDSEEKYLTFEPDLGGFNNIRMSLETVLTLALLTNRTLVMPPPQVFYLLGNKKGEVVEDFEVHKGYDRFFPFGDEGFKSKVKIITMHDFLIKNGNAPTSINNNNKPLNLTLEQFISKDNEKLKYTGEQVLLASKQCEKHKSLGIKCEVINEYLRASTDFTPAWSPVGNCLIFNDDDTSIGGIDGIDSTMGDKDKKRRILEFCKGRKPVYYTPQLKSTKFIHLASGSGPHRLLTHFYTFIHSTNLQLDHYVKRFIRDHIRYIDTIFCTASVIVQDLVRESLAMGHDGSYVTFHIRRGDFQYTEVKISAEEMVGNTLDLLRPNELIFISTDERNTTFFKPFTTAGHTVKFLNDYHELAKLKATDSAYYGMIDTLIASTGRVFIGTWFSTFTGYIVRLRGYMGKDERSSWYSYLPRKTVYQTWDSPRKAYFQREWATAWKGIGYVKGGEEECRGIDGCVYLEPSDEVKREREWTDVNGVLHEKTGENSIKKSLGVGGGK